MTLLPSWLRTPLDFQRNASSSTPTTRIFVGTGVYALYYTGDNGLYQRYAELNRLAYSHPIYVGKAVPKGWRQSEHLTAGKEPNPRNYFLG